MSSYTTSPPPIHTVLPEVVIDIDTETRQHKDVTAYPIISSSVLPRLLAYSQSVWIVFAVAVFLVSVPVFIEAPLVRSLPWLSLAMTAGWVWLGYFLMSRPATYVWGDLLIGFSWSWLAGSIYWGWLRWEPLWHLPVETIGLPFAIWCLSRNLVKVGNWFYLGSLLGTVLTDVYFYLVDLMPYWRQVMLVEPVHVSPILRSAVVQVHTPWGQAWALILAAVLLTVGILPLRYKQQNWYAFGGAVLSTILVDSLFLLAASLA